MKLKKLVAMLLAAVLCFGLAACGNNAAQPSGGSPSAQNPGAPSAQDPSSGNEPPAANVPDDLPPYIDHC